jgi:glycosyltransferase involved in cell wall biosynthesis
MSHILFVTPYYPPEVGAPQARISETAVGLARRGHHVTVLTTLPNYPSGVVQPEYRAGKRRREVLDGVHVVRVWSYIRPNRGFLGRLLSQLSFGCMAGLLGARASGRPDVIIVESPPLFDAFAGRFLAWRKRCPYIFTVADIWPESAVQLGALHNRLAIWLAEQLEWSTYQHASAIWAVTAGIRQTLVVRGCPPERVFLLPNGVDTTTFRPQDKVRARAELAWDKRFTVVYAGTMGLAQGLGTLLDAAQALQGQPDIRLVMVGDGAARSDLMAEASRRELHNVTFLAPQPHERMPLVLAGADACLVALRKVPLFQGALPSKMYEAMACSRPIVLAVDGEARRLAADEAGAAMYVEPEDPSGLSQAIIALRDHPDMAMQMGDRGRALVEARFDRNMLTTSLETRLAALVTRDQAPARSRKVPVITVDK